MSKTKRIAYLWLFIILGISSLIWMNQAWSNIFQAHQLGGLTLKGVKMLLFNSHFITDYVMGNVFALLGAISFERALWD